MTRHGIDVKTPSGFSSCTSNLSPPLHNLPSCLVITSAAVVRLPCWVLIRLLPFKNRAACPLLLILHAVAAAAFLGKLSLFLQGADNITGQITQVVVIQFV